jgi:hypothetical protein
MASKFERLIDTINLCNDGILEADNGFLCSPIETLETICNGCGAADSKFDFVPDTMYGLYIGYACQIHDWDYHTGSTANHKKLADRRFHRNLRALIKQAHWLLRYPRYTRAWLYYKTVQKKGGDAFYG